MRREMIFWFNLRYSMECLSFSANNIWVKIQCSGDLPSSRDGHACTSIGPYMYIHGGFSANVSKLNPPSLCL